LRRPAAAAAAGLLALAWAAILLVDPWADEEVNDLFLYRAFAALFLDGELPYRDVAFEYPPLAAPLLALAGVLGTGHDEYRLAFAGLMLAFAAALVVLCGALARRTGGDPARAMLAAAAAPLVTGAMIRTHFDLAPVALLCAGLLAITSARPRLGFLLLGIGTATKLFPAVAVPVALAWLAGRGEQRAAVHGAAVFAATVACVAAVALLVSPSGFADSFEYHLDRPVQVESAPALLLLALDGLGAGDAESVNAFRSDGLEHPASGLLVAVFTAALLAVIGAFGLAARAGPDARRLVLAALAVVAAFAALGKVLSPQFLVWLIPLGALALAWRAHGLALAVAGATLLTLVEFPSRYFDLVAREPFPLAVVAARDVLMLVTVALAWRACSSPSPSSRS
jgi:uncharacterized membrane protein